MGEPLRLGDRYELRQPIGSGGFGTVYRAHDRHTDTDVAVKLVARGFDATHLADRLRAEASILRKLSSRYVARVIDLGTDAQGVWLVTELIEGVPLAIESLGRALLPHEVLRVARGVLEGLAAAHTAGVVHADIKPSNILVPRGEDGLDNPTLIDFGLARVTPRADLAAHLGDAVPASGIALGTARWMAPEVLTGRAADARSDVYSLGLVLFELLGIGDLFAAGDRRAQMRARITSDPSFEGRVPEPLAAVLARMLARDTEHRFVDADSAFHAVVDLDTAPRGTPALLTTSAPASTREPPRVSSIPAAARAPGAPPPMEPRLRSLRADGVEALFDTLRHFDLPMLDALARRERGGATGRVARAVALALRLEIDAAALVLEPLMSSSAVARGVGATFLGPRARRATRARIDPDTDDAWVDAVPPPLAALFASFAASVSRSRDAARNHARCVRALRRLEEAAGPNGDVRDDGNAAWERRDGDWNALRSTTLLALRATQVASGELSPASANLGALQERDELAQSAFERVARPLLAGAIDAAIDEGRARDHLERASRAASESGVTLLEASASAAWGRLLVQAPHRMGQGMELLERAATLLAHGDAPSLEHASQHYRGAALLARGRTSEAMLCLQSARKAADAEEDVDAATSTASLELAAMVCRTDDATGDTPGDAALSLLTDSRLDALSGDVAGFAWIARALSALAGADLTGARASARAAIARAGHRGPGPADAYVVGTALRIVIDAAESGEAIVARSGAELERFVTEHGFSSFYWLDVVRNVLAKTEPAARAPMEAALSRVTLRLGAASRTARDRRTSAPPQ